MENLHNQELLAINGGISKTLFGAFVVGVVFLASVIYGFVNPYRCD